MPTCTPGSTTTTYFGLCKPADGETNWGTAYRTSMDTIDTALHNVGIPRSYLAGLGTTPTVASTSVSIAAGVAMGNDQSTSIVLSSTLVKVLSSSWAVGTGNGGLYAATSIQGNQTYHLFVIIRTDTSVVDAYYDTSVTAANIPSPYTVYRRIASLRTATSSNLVNYVQDGDYFRLVSSSLDVSTANPGTSAITATLKSVPSGLNLLAQVNAVYFGGTTADVTMYVSDLAASDEGPSDIQAPLSTGGVSPSASTGGPGGFTLVRTNTSSQIRYRVNASGAADRAGFCTLGWFDTRGRNT